MEQLKTMKDQLISVVQGQLGCLDKVDAKELGEAIDMIKDLSEASYYCAITKAMEEQEKESMTKPAYYTHMPYEDYYNGQMYYSGSGQRSSGQSNGGNNYYTQRHMGGNPVYYREYEYDNNSMWDQSNYSDPKEGRAKQSRRMYMEAKELHKDSNTQMKELEKYIQDLSNDISEMIMQATPEEKQVLQSKIATLATKIK